MLDDVLNGSPPRVWGQELWTGHSWARPAVHPHVCGDNTLGTLLTDGGFDAVHPHSGEDNLLFDPTVVTESRFTPTRVGTTSHPTEL